MNAVVQTKSKLPSYISLLLVAVLGIMLAKLMWLIIAPKTQVMTNIQVDTNIVSTPKQKINYGKLIANQHLFGVVKVKKAEPIAKTPEPETPKVTPTKLNLKLHGIVAYKKSKGGFALISSGGSLQKVYGKGDTIEEGVTISEIFADKVVLDNHGRTEDLILPSKQVSRRGGGSSRRSMGSGFNPDTGEPDLMPGMGMDDGGPPGPVSASEPDLSSFREEMLENPSKLMSVARSSPAIIDGKFVGFRIYPGSRRTLFRKLGFRPNDIITEVNGIVIDDMSKGAMIIGELSQASTLSVRVKRGNQEITIDHNF